MRAVRENAGFKKFVLALIAIALIIIGLIYGRTFLIPMVIAGLIITLIQAGARRLERLGLGYRISTALIVLTLLVAIAAMFNVLFGQADAVSEAIPRYADRLRELMKEAADWAGPKISSRVAETWSEINLANRLLAILGSLGSFFGSFALVVLYVGFLLAENGRLSGKLDRMFASSEQAHRTRLILTNISTGISSYIWAKTIMSLLTGGISFVVLKMLEVDFAETWALLIFLLNYIPSIGSTLGVVFPALLALIQFDTTWQFFLISSVLALTQFVIGNIIEPAFMGRTLNISPFVVMASLAFWGLIWGVPGAFLSVPLTAALIISCNSIPTLRWIGILLSAGEPSHEVGNDRDQ